MAIEVAIGSGRAMGTLGRIPVRQLVALMVGAAAAIAMAVGAWMWTQSTDYKVLYSNLSDRDGGTIISALTQMNVPYKFSDGGSAILVPSAQVHDARLRLASQGLPKGSVVGFELVDNQKFGATQFQEQVNYQRGLEGELAKSVQTLSAVQAARVHLAIPKPSVFVRDQQAPSASVLVTLHPAKTLTREQVTGILNLVASSVPELSPKNVSVLNQNGDLLSANGTGAETGGLDASQLSYVQQIEQSTIQRIVDILDPIVGRGNARVQVSADVNFSRVEAVAETFKPNQDPKVASVRQQQSTQSTTTGAAGAQGVPGALTNQPPVGGTAAIDAKANPASPPPAGAPSSIRKDESVAYEVDKTIQHTTSPYGNIKRMTAAVVINHRKQTDDGGTVTTAPLKPEEMEQINALVREAMGFSKDRGDSLNIVNTPFNVTEQEVVPEVSFWKNPDTIAAAKDVGRYTLLIAIIAYLYFGLLKPLFNKAMTMTPAPPEALTLEHERAAAGRAGSGEMLTDARRIAREDPKVVANVVKAWVATDE
jgi:flagellar M-ring protein FliF